MSPDLTLTLELHRAMKRQPPEKVFDGCGAALLAVDVGVGFDPNPKFYILFNKIADPLLATTFTISQQARYFLNPKNSDKPVDQSDSFSGV
jgi:hypothetical protein